MAPRHQGWQREARGRKKQGDPYTQQREHRVQGGRAEHAEEGIHRQSYRENVDTDGHESHGANRQRSETGARRKRHPEPNPLHHYSPSSFRYWT